MKRFFVISFFMFSTILVFGQDITGEWNGNLKVQGHQLRVVIHITKSDSIYSATLDSPDQGAKDIPMNKVTFNNPVITIEWTASNFKYIGKLSSTGIIYGSLTQMGQTFPMNLVKIIENSNILKVPELKDTTSLETPVILKTKSGQIYGTLTTPKKFSKIPVVLIIAGSGPTDRNCNNFMMKCNAYKELAYGLAGNNIASIRYDKRGVAESFAAGKNEKDLRIEDYINDATEWIQLLKQDNRFSKVIVIGHSEGSLIGMISATGATKFISIAGPGQSFDKSLKEQLSKQPKVVIDLSFPIIDSLKNGKTVDKVDPMLNSLFRLSVQPYLISCFKYDPQIEIKKLKIPVLIIQGTNDLQVTVEDAKQLSKANPKSQLILINKMNHIFKIVDGDNQANIATYNNPTLPLADELVRDITIFILK